MSKVVVVIFRRGEFWYPVEYPAAYANWQAEALRNPGTTQIETAQGEVLWRAPAIRKGEGA